MSKYKNGRIPKNKLIRRGTSHYATAGTWAKWDALVADVKKNEGVTLRITVGNNAYRDYASQVAAKKKHGKNAAFPGTSSHGGVFNGEDAMAVDVANWGDIGQTEFYQYARKHGFEPGYFSWEPWHIIDWEPWRAVAPVPTPNPAPESEEDEMYFTFVQGKEKSHRSGVFAHMRDNNGIWFAKRFNYDTENTQGLPVIANTQLESWQNTMRFLDLV